MIRPQVVAPQVTIAEEQDEFLPITAALVHNGGYAAVPTEHGPLNTVLLAFRLSDAERQQLAAGEDLYVALLTFLQPMQGICLFTGKTRAAEAFGLKVEP